MTQTPRGSPSAEAQAAKLRGLLESAVTAIVTIDDGGLIENFNPATERLFSYAPAELIAQNVKVLMPEPYKAEHDGYIANYLETGVKKIIGIGREVSGRRKDGIIGQRILGRRPALLHGYAPRFKRQQAR
jgi:PAS domain S-box-containing protein